MHTGCVYIHPDNQGSLLSGLLPLSPGRSILNRRYATTVPKSGVGYLASAIRHGMKLGPEPSNNITRSLLLALSLAL